MDSLVRFRLIIHGSEKSVIRAIALQNRSVLTTLPHRLAVTIRTHRQMVCLGAVKFVLFRVIKPIESVP